MRTSTLINLFIAFTSSSALAASATTGGRFDKRTGLIHWEDSKAPLLQKRDGGDSFTSSFGLMIERSVDESEIQKRDSLFEAESDRKRTRDLNKFTAKLGLTERGEIVGLKRYFDMAKTPASNLVKRRHHHHGKKHHRHGHRSKSKKHRGHHSKSKKTNRKARKHHTRKATSKGNTNLNVSPNNAIAAFNGIITWYTKKDLLNPFCDSQSSWTPTDNSLVCAPTMVWNKRPACGSFLRLTAPGSDKSVVVRVVDVCGGCAPGVPHIDLTLAAFSKLYNTEVGLVSNIHVQTLDGPPFDNWDASMTALYGPRNL